MALQEQAPAVPKENVVRDNLPHDLENLFDWQHPDPTRRQFLHLFELIQEANDYGPITRKFDSWSLDHKLLVIEEERQKQRWGYYKVQDKAEIAVLDVFQNKFSYTTPLAASVNDFHHGVWNRRTVEPHPFYLRLTLALAARKGSTEAFGIANDLYKWIKTVNIDVLNKDETFIQQGYLINRERALLFAEVAAHPKLGLQLLAKYMYDDPIFDNIITELDKVNMGDLTSELLQEKEENRKLQADTAVVTDKNHQKIVEELKAMEFPRLMQFFLQAVISVQEAKNEPHLIREYLYSRSKYWNINSDARYEAYNTVRQIHNHPLLDALVDFAPCPIMDKLIEQHVSSLIGIMPDKVKKLSEPDAAGRRVPLTQTEVYDPGSRGMTPKQREMAGWAAMRFFRGKFRFKNFSKETQTKIIEDIRGGWRKRDVFKAGLPFPPSVRQFLESVIDFEPAMDLLYTHFIHLLNINFGISANEFKRIPEDVTNAYDQVLRSLSKRVMIKEGKIELRVTTDREKSLLNALAKTVVSISDQYPALLASKIQFELLSASTAAASYGKSTDGTQNEDKMLFVERAKGIQYLAVDLNYYFKGVLDQAVVASLEKIATSKDSYLQKTDDAPHGASIQVQV